MGSGRHLKLATKAETMQEQFAGLLNYVSYTSQAQQPTVGSVLSHQFTMMMVMMVTMMMMIPTEVSTQYSAGGNSSTVVLSSQVCQVEKPELAISSWKEILRGSLDF